MLLCLFSEFWNGMRCLSSVEANRQIPIVLWLLVSLGVQWVFLLPFFEGELLVALPDFLSHVILPTLIHHLWWWRVITQLVYHYLLSRQIRKATLLILILKLIDFVPAVFLECVIHSFPFWLIHLLNLGLALAELSKVLDITLVFTTWHWEFTLFILELD